MNLTRQPLLIALLTLLAVLGAVCARKVGMSFGPEVIEAPTTLLGGWVNALQTEWPRLAWGLWFLLHTAAALTLGRIGIRYGLYAGNSLLTIPLYGVVACGIFLGNSYLLGAMVGLLMARIARNYAAACRNGYAFNALFRGSLYLGLLPLLYAPALPLVVLVLITTILFQRTMREWIVALCGLLFPAAALCYLNWAFSNDFTAPLLELWQGLLAAEPLPIFQGGSVVLVLQLVVLLAAVLWALFYYLSDIYAATSKARAILTSEVWLFLLALASLFLPGASVTSFPLLATPTVLLLPFLFVRLERRLANILYLLMLLLTLLRLFW